MSKIEDKHNKYLDELIEMSNDRKIDGEIEEYEEIQQEFIEKNLGDAEFNKAYLKSILKELKGQKFINVLLNPRIKWYNFGCYLIMICMYQLTISSTSLLIYLIQDPNYYVVSSDDLGTITGDLQFYPSLIGLFFEFPIGALMDIVGRKTPVIGGFIIIGIASIIIPYGKYILILILLKTIIQIGLKPCQNIPLLPDYVQLESQGFANAYVAACGCSGALIGSCVLTQISVHIEYVYIYIGMGILIFIVCVLFLFGIKDVLKDTKFIKEMERLYTVKKTLKQIESVELKEKEDKVEEDDNEFEFEKKQKIPLKTQIKEIYYHLKMSIIQDKEIIITLILGFVQQFSQTALTQYGILVITAAYGSSVEEQNEAKTYSSLLTLIAQIITIVTVFFFGFITDKGFPVWIQTLIIAGICSIFFTLNAIFMYDVKSIIYAIINIGAQIGNAAQMGIGKTLLSKVKNKKARASLFSFYGFMFSAGMIVSSKLMGWLYDDYSSTWPFILSAISNAILLVVGIIIAFMYKLKL